MTEQYIRQYSTSTVQPIAQTITNTERPNHRVYSTSNNSVHHKNGNQHSLSRQEESINRLVFNFYL